MSTQHCCFLAVGLSGNATFCQFPACLSCHLYLRLLYFDCCHRWRFVAVLLLLKTVYDGSMKIYVYIYKMYIYIFMCHAFGGHLLLLFVKFVVCFALLLKMCCFPFDIACCSWRCSNDTKGCSYTHSFSYVHIQNVSQVGADHGCGVIYQSW